ncbi:hypothetical protein CI102_8881 [Trichoderma harzianum]|nr:hypothetical protein CI102_8881 [Trichoderma harzianum]
MASHVYASAFQCCVPDPAKPNARLSEQEEAFSCKINRALASGPIQVTKDATVAEWTHDREVKVIHEGTNGWTCFPGNENHVVNVPMACDAQGLQWIKDAYAGKEKPTNTAPGIIYMMCGANQHSSVRAWVMFDGTPYADLHVCGNPWAGKEYDSETNKANWDLRYLTR